MDPPHNLLSEQSATHEDHSLLPEAQSIERVSINSPENALAQGLSENTHTTSQPPEW